SAASIGVVDQFHGTYSNNVPIAVPAFRGLEPKIGLRYSSSNGNGYVGVGWELGGFSVIERASPGRGAPNYNSSDIFMLDGQELVPCPQSGSVSPSCTTGGTHSAKVESYSKIKFDSVANKWTMWAKDGTQTVFGGPPNAYSVGTGPDGVWGNA